METAKVVWVDSWRCSGCGRELDEIEFPEHLDRCCFLCIRKETPFVDFIPIDGINGLKHREAKREAKSRDAYAAGVCGFNRWKKRDFSGVVKLLRKRHNRLERVVPLPRIPHNATELISAWFEAH